MNLKLDKKSLLLSNNDVILAVMRLFTHNLTYDYTKIRLQTTK